jgi:hypothetical protein
MLAVRQPAEIRSAAVIGCGVVRLAGWLAMHSSARVVRIDLGGPLPDRGAVRGRRDEPLSRDRGLDRPRPVLVRLWDRDFPYPTRVRREGSPISRLRATAGRGGGRKPGRSATGRSRRAGLGRPDVRRETRGGVRERLRRRSPDTDGRWWKGEPLHVAAGGRRCVSDAVSVRDTGPRLQPMPPRNAAFPERRWAVRSFLTAPCDGVTSP